MRKILSLVIIFLFSILSFAQENLIVNYNFQSKFQFPKDHVSSPLEQSKLKELLAEVHTYQLIIKGKESNFNKIEKIRNDQHDGMMSFSVGKESSPRYKNLDEKITEKQENYLNVNYLLKDSLKDFNWQITRERSEILGLAVRKAISEDDSEIITAWYAPQINISNGPEDYWGLPGLILEIDIVDKKKEGLGSHYWASSIDMPKDEIIIERPKEGKIMTTREYYTERNARNKKMLEMYSQGVDTSD